MTDDGERFRRWITEGSDAENPAIPAATVILLRDAEFGLETLMLRRNSKLAFGGMWVFPGGRVDDGDRVGAEHDYEAAKRAAVREAHEESGLAVVLDQLVPMSHWTPPPQTPKRFATWFFVAPAPAGAVVIDDGEIHEHMWVSPTAAIAQRDDGQIELAPPTWVTLQTLARATTTGEAITLAAGRDPDIFVTQIAMTDDGLAALWAGDAGYDTADAAVPGPRHRLVMNERAWRYERND